MRRLMLLFFIFVGGCIVPSTCSNQPPVALTLNYTKGSVTTFHFDLCSIINCGSSSSGWRGYDVYLCMYLNAYRWCPTWDFVFAWTGVNWNSAPCPDGHLCTRDKITISRRPYTGQDGEGHNPLSLSITSLNQTPDSSRLCGSDAFCLIAGVDVYGKDPMALIKINLT